jgi:hypothetical protein
MSFPPVLDDLGTALGAGLTLGCLAILAAWP